MLGRIVVLPEYRLRGIGTCVVREAEAWAKQELTRLKVDGLTGSVTTFGQRHIGLLDTVAIVIDGKRMGRYQVKANTITFGRDG